MRRSTHIAVACRAVGVLLLAVVLASCGDVGSGDGTPPSISPSRTPTAEAPSPTGTATESTSEPTGEPTDDATSTEPPPELPSPTRTPEGTERPEQPETTPTTEPTPTTPTPTGPEPTEPVPETVTESPEAQEPEPEAEAEPVEEDVPSWGWLLVAALVLGCLVAIPLVVRSRRRNAWDQDLAAEEAEVAWLARDLLPELRRAASREEVAGGWSVSQARVSATEDRLTVLESSGPDEQRRARARVLRDASRAARAQVQRLLGPGPHDTWALDLDAIIIDLETALRSTRATPPT